MPLPPEYLPPRRTPARHIYPIYPILYTLLCKPMLMRRRPLRNMTTDNTLPVISLRLRLVGIGN